MCKVLLCMLLLLVFSLSAQAQDCCSKYEISGKFSYFNAGGKGDGIVSDQFNSRSGQNGWGGNFAVNRVWKFDVVADVSYQRKELTISALSIGGVPLSDARTKLSSLVFLFGPRLSSRSDEINFFVHALAGGIHKKVESTGSLGTDTPSVSGTIASSSTDFALGFGGGVDLKAVKHVSVRLFQFDYIPARVASDSSSDGHQWSHNYRLQAGIVIHWGLAK
jgi:opacity protein-like surface antigen